MQKLILIGGGGHCNSCIDVIEQQGIYSIEGILDLQDNLNKEILGYKYIGTDSDIPQYAKSGFNFLITIGHIKTVELRISLYRLLLQENANIATIISPLAYVSKHAKIGKGTILMHHALVNANATIGVNCIINTKALVEHDAIIGDFTHISTGAIVNGGVRVGKETFFGSNAVSKQYIDIPDFSFIKANSLVK